MTIKALPPPAPGRGDVESFADAAANLLEMPIDPAYRASVVQNLAVLMGHARLVMAFALDSAIEVAPVFRA